MLDGFEYIKPYSLAEAFKRFNEEGTLLLAGGTDVIVNLREEKIKVKQLLDLKGLTELKGIKKIPGGVHIGALTLIEEIVRSPLLNKYRALYEGASRLGCLEIRWRATVGGNICNGSPSADTVPGFLLYNAEVLICSKEGKRRMTLENFLVGPGKVNLNAGEILIAVILPDVSDFADSRYYRISRVKGMDLSSINVGVYAEHQEHNVLTSIRIVLGAVLPKVTRMHEAEVFINTELLTETRLKFAIDTILTKIYPRKGSLRASPAYKKQMVAELIKKGLSDMLGGDGNEA